MSVFLRQHIVTAIGMLTLLMGGIAFAQSVHAQTSPSSIVVHVPPRIPTSYGLFGIPKTFAPDSVAYTKTNMINEAAKISPAAKAQMESGLNNGTIKVNADTQDVMSAQKDTSWLEVDGKNVAQGSDGIKAKLKQISDAASQKLSDTADEKLVGKDIVVGTEQIYVDPLTHKGQTFIPKPSKPIKPPTISLEKQQELAQDEAGGVPITAVGNEIMFTHPATVNLGVEVGPGTYQVGKCQQNQKPGAGYVQPDASGNFTSCAEPKAPGSDSGFGGPSGNQGGGGSGGSGAGGAGGGLGGLGGLGQMLPLLLAGMLGGGLGGQGNQAGQGQNGLNSNGLTNTQTSCSAYGTSPVCGSDGKTYTNSCYLQQYSVVQVSTGVCASPSTSPSPTPDVAKIVMQLLAAGVPQAVIDDIIRAITAIAGNTNGADVVVQ